VIGSRRCECLLRGCRPLLDVRHSIGQRVDDEREHEHVDDQRDQQWEGDPPMLGEHAARQADAGERHGAVPPAAGRIGGR
jgi:hypothetical protein